MADNDNALPLKAGKLPRSCYSSWQEFTDDLVKVLQIAQDTKEIIQGAKGDTGATGAKGNKGDVGPPGTNTNITTRVFPIPTLGIYVQVPIFDGWETSTYKIRYDGRIAPASDVVLPFDDEAGYIAVGTIVLVDGVPAPTAFRVYFVFSPGIVAVPDANFILHVTTLS